MGNFYTDDQGRIRKMESGNGIHSSQMRFPRIVVRMPKPSRFVKKSLSRSKYNIGDEVIHHYGRGKITHIRNDPNGEEEPKYKINGKYVNESNIYYNTKNFADWIENNPNMNIGITQEEWSSFNPKEKLAVIKHVYEDELDESLPNLIEYYVSTASWDELPKEFRNKVVSNAEEYGKARYESIHDL